MKVEHADHLVSATGTSAQKEMLQLIGLTNYVRDHVLTMTKMVNPYEA